MNHLKIICRFTEFYMNVIISLYLLFHLGELFVFYSIFYLVLAILCAICMKVLFSTLDDKIPKYTLDESRIGSNPGLGFRPLPKNLDKGSLIWFSAKNETQVDHLNDLIEIFLQRK